MQQLRSVGVVRVHQGDREKASDRAAVEEPLEVRVDGRAFAVIMRSFDIYSHGERIEPAGHPAGRTRQPAPTDSL